MTVKLILGDCLDVLKKFEDNSIDSLVTDPTVKPLKLMSYLINMITPPSGIVLDPFMGSGSTGVAAVKSGFNFIGMEKEPEYFEIAKARINYHDPKNEEKNLFSKEDLGEQLEI